MQIISEISKATGVTEFVIGLICGFIAAWIVIPKKSSSKNAFSSLNTSPSLSMESGSEIKITSAEIPVKMTTTNLDDQTVQAIKSALECGDKIEAIKILRASTNCDLAAAKSAVEGLEKVFKLVP